MTYRQAQELGAKVSKGERGSLVVYDNRLTRTETNAAGEEVEREIAFLKGYTVFNCEQIDGLPPHFTAPAAPVLDPVERIAHAETFFANTRANICYGVN
jgi:antirestriction protein ArdC